MKIKVAVAKSVKALVGHMAKAACGSASHWGAYQPKEPKFKKEKKLECMMAIAIVFIDIHSME